MGKHTYDYLSATLSTLFENEKNVLFHYMRVPHLLVESHLADRHFVDTHSIKRDM
jgi:hypothetical protein